MVEAIVALAAFLLISVTTAGLFAAIAAGGKGETWRKPSRSRRAPVTPLRRRSQRAAYR